MSGGRIGLVLHPRRDCSAAAGQIAAWTSAHGVDLVASAADAQRLAVAGVRPVPTLAEGCDGLIALGGDGTLLGAMRLVADHPVPVFGVNLGRLGFLAEVEDGELDAALSALTEGRVTTESRSCLEVRLPGWSGTAFNDVVLARVPGEGLVQAVLSVSGRRYGRYHCDALIVATPMGSTAYNHSAGGPVVSPGAGGLVVTPSAPMNGIDRSLVLGPGEPLRLELTGGVPAVEVDGRLTGRCAVGDVLEVATRADAGRLVRIGDSVAAERSRIKLSLLDLPLLPDELLELVPESLRRRPLGGVPDPG